MKKGKCPTHRSKARSMIVRVWEIDTIVRRRRVLRRERRRSARSVIWTAVPGPTSPLSLLNERFVDLAGAPSAITIQTVDYGEEDEDWLWGMMKFELVKAIEVVQESCDAG